MLTVRRCAGTDPGSPGPARIVSSVLTASTWRCCSATRQSAHVTTSTMTGGGSISWMRCSDVVPFTAHTRLPDRSDAWAIARVAGRQDPLVGRRGTRWRSSTSFLRSQVMLMVLTTMSTWLFCSAVIRSADDRMRYSTCDGVPKMSRATSPAMSTSKPVISPVIGSRKLSRLLPMSRPTMSLPRLRMLATAASASAFVGNGRRLAVQSVVVGEVGPPSRARAPTPSMPAGVGRRQRHARLGDRRARPRSQPRQHDARRRATAISFSRSTIIGTRSISATAPAPPRSPRSR